MKSFFGVPNMVLSQGLEEFCFLCFLWETSGHFIQMKNIEYFIYSLRHAAGHQLEPALADRLMMLIHSQTVD